MFPKKIGMTLATNKIKAAYKNNLTRPENSAISS
jgi:hypothetical protein